MTRIKILFGVCTGIFLLNLLLLKTSVQLPVFFSSYMNDLLCMPVVLSICLFIIQKIKKQKDLKISFFSAFSLAVLYSVYFEIYLPEVTTRYTSDIVDVFLYFTGALIFWLVQRSEISQKFQPEKKAAQIEQL